MPISTLSPVPNMQKPCRILIYVDLNTLREYDSSIAPFSSTDSGSSILRKTKDAVTSVGTDIHKLLFASDATIPELRCGLRGYGDETNEATLRLGYGYSFGHDTFDTPVLAFTSRCVQDKQLVFTIRELDDELRRMLNEDLAFQYADMPLGEPVDSHKEAMN